jgi:Sulfotransferase domain
MEASFRTATHAATRSQGQAGAVPGTGALPNAIVIGAQKCGTSTLHYYLRYHPQICASTPKELDFFIEEHNWGLGADWYCGHFDPAVRCRLESSPNYTTYPHFQGVPERMHAMVPDARLIYLVRDPIARIEAHWVHNYAKRRERGTVLETIAHPGTTYIMRSRYFMQLEQFLAHYDPSRILVLDQDDLRHRRSQALRRIFEFVGVDPDFDHPALTTVRHRTERKRRTTRLGGRVEKLSRTRVGKRIPKAAWNYAQAGLRLSRPIERPNLRQALPPEIVRVLREDAECLREFSGNDFASWSIWHL